MGKDLSQEQLERWRKKHPSIEVGHCMGDGGKRESVEGYSVPWNEDTKLLYRIVSEMLHNLSL